MSYLDELAVRIRDEVPESHRGETALDLFRLYAVLALAKGEAVQASDVHNAWAAWMQEREPDHEALRPFEELDKETREADYPFVLAIRAVASAEDSDKAER
jgi:hypothetical protein